MKKSIKNYFGRMRGGKHCPPRAPMVEVFWSTIGGFLGIAAVYWTGHLEGLSLTDKVFLIGSFGASAVLLYGIPLSPFSQPRNLLGGHVFSAIIGVSCYYLLHNTPGIAAAMAVGLSIGFMHLTRTLHPPGGASALIAIVGSSHVHALGYWYVLLPVGAGALVMLLVAVTVNNLASSRHYPEYWW